MNQNKFTNQFPEFKPEFGNRDHIHILEKMKHYYTLRTQYEAYRKQKGEMIAMRKKCRNLKDEIRKMIKYLQK